VGNSNLRGLESSFDLGENWGKPNHPRGGKKIRLESRRGQTKKEIMHRGCTHSKVAVPDSEGGGSNW